MGAFGPPVAITELNSGASEGNAMFGSDQLSVFFNTDRSGDNELYVAKRASAADPFGAPALIAELSSLANDETDPWISQDGRTLYFTSNRDGTQRLWQTTR